MTSGAIRNESLEFLQQVAQSRRDVVSAAPVSAVTNTTGTTNTSATTTTTITTAAASVNTPTTTAAPTTCDPATTSLFDAAVAASRLLFGDNKPPGSALEDPNIVRRFSTEVVQDFNFFIPFVGTISKLSSAVLKQEVTKTSAKNVDAHREVIAKWIVQTSETQLNISTGATLLLYAVLSGDISLLQSMIDLGANPFNTNFLRSTVLRPHTMRHGIPLVMIACAVGRLNILRLLCVYAGASPICHDRWGRTPLHIAAAMNHADIIQWLVDNTELGRATCDRDSRRAIDYLPQSATKELRQLLTPVEVPRCNLASMKGEKAPLLYWCHCRGATQPCSCPDAFFERWYMDRANSSWLPVDVITAMNTVHKKAYGNSVSQKDTRNT